MARVTFEHVCEEEAIFGTPEYCIEKIKWARDILGVTTLICWFNCGGLVPHEKILRSKKLFAKEVMPYFLSL